MPRALADTSMMSTQEDLRERVLIGYGEVMAIVQMWEQALAIVWWRTQRKNANRPSGDFDTARSQQEIRRLEAAFLRMSAQAVREAVAPHLDTETASDLTRLMAERNRLAHRFLREQAADHGNFKPGTHDQLVALGNTFIASVDSIMRTIEGFAPYAGPVLPRWPEVSERIVERLFRGDPIPRDPAQQ